MDEKMKSAEAKLLRDIENTRSALQAAKISIDYALVNRLAAKLARLRSRLAALTG